MKTLREFFFPSNRERHQFLMQKRPLRALLVIYLIGLVALPFLYAPDLLEIIADTCIWHSSEKFPCHEALVIVLGVMAIVYIPSLIFHYLAQFMFFNIVMDSIFKDQI